MKTLELMGALVFFLGLVMLITTVVAVLDPAVLPFGERLVLFVAGAATCLIGYYMATHDTPVV